MNIKQLQYFIAIVESGTISSAAVKLGICQPPLSAQLKLLEEEVGCQLLHRGARKITLTEAGRVLYQKAVSIVTLADDTLQELSNFTGNRKKTLRIGAASTTAHAILSRMKGYCQIYPNVDFEVYEGNTYELLDLLHEDVIQVAIVRTPFVRTGYECGFLEEEPMAVLGDRSFFDGQQESRLSLSDLKGKPLIIYRRMEHLIVAAFQKREIEPNIHCKTDDSKTAFLWAKAKMGVAMVPRELLPTMDLSGMEYHELNERSLITRMAVVRKKGHKHMPEADAFYKQFVIEE